MKKSILNIALLSMLFVLGACSVDKGEGNGGNGGGDIVDPVDPSTPDGAAKIDAWVKTINDANLYETDVNNDGTMNKITLASDGSFDFGMLGKLTIHGFKSDTQVVYKRSLPLDETGAVTVDTYMGMVFENNSFKLADIKVEYEFNGDENTATPEDWKAYYAKIYAVDNIDWDKTGVRAKALATADQKKAFAADLNAKNLKAENAKDKDISEMLDFTVADDGTFIIKGTEYENGDYVLKDTTYYMVFYTSSTEAEFTNSGQVNYIDLETLAFVDGKFGKMEQTGPNTIEMSEIIAVQDSSAESKTTWIKSVNDAPLKHWEIDNMGVGSLKDFTLDATTGVFTRGSVPNLTTYTFLRADSATTAVYTDNKTRATVSVTLVDGLFEVNSSIVSTTVSTSAQITAYTTPVNAKGLVYKKNNGGTTTVIPFTFTDGKFEDYTIIRVLADSTVLMLSGSGISIYGLVGDKFGYVYYSNDEISISSVMAVMPLDTVDASHQAAFKTAIVGSYTVRIDNEDKAFTIAADGSFTLNAVAYTLHDTRSATEGIFKTTDNKYIGISIPNSSQLKLHAKLDSDSYTALEGATTLATVNWFDSRFNAYKDRN